MPRRFALTLLGLLVVLLVGLLAGRTWLSPRPARPSKAMPTLKPTPVVPPTPIPPRRIALYFESLDDEKLRPEARDIPATADDIGFLKAVAREVLEGPRHPALLRPFPEGWTVRAAFRLANGIAVVDLAYPEEARAAELEGPPVPGTPTPTATPRYLMPQQPRWETGSHQEDMAVQSLLLSIVKNAPDVARVVLLVGGEPVDTLGGHLDLTHPLVPDPTRGSDEAPLEPPTPTPAPEPKAEGEGPAQTAEPAEPALAASPTPTLTPRPTKTPGPTKTPRPAKTAVGDSV